MTLSLHMKINRLLHSGSPRLLPSGCLILFIQSPEPKLQKPGAGIPAYTFYSANAPETALVKDNGLHPFKGIITGSYKAAVQPQPGYYRIKTACATLLMTQTAVA